MRGDIYSWICLFCIVASTAHAQNDVSTHPVDGQFIKEWLVLGPFFPRDLDTDFLAPAGGEADIDPREGDTIITSDNRTLVWKRYTTKRLGIDLLDAVGNHQNAVAYAFCHLESDIAETVEIRFGSDNGGSVWFNGKRVSHQPGSRGLVLDQDRFLVEMLAGTNRCLVKVSQYALSWGFAIRTAPDAAWEEMSSGEPTSGGKVIPVGDGTVVTAGEGRVTPAGRGVGHWRTFDVTDGLAGLVITRSYALAVQHAL